MESSIYFSFYWPNVIDRMLEMKKKHNREIKEAIENYKVVSNRTNANLDYSRLPNNCNIILFGPSKSGKSSLIK